MFAVNKAYFIVLHETDNLIYSP